MEGKQMYSQWMSLTWEQEMELSKRITHEVLTNDDPHTTVGDIYDFERMIFEKELLMEGN